MKEEQKKGILYDRHHMVVYSDIFAVASDRSIMRREFIVTVEQN